MVAAGEAGDPGPAGRLARQLERRLDRVGAGRAAELHLVVEAARAENAGFEQLEEAALGDGMQVERAGDAAGQQILADRLHQRGVVMAVVQRPGAGEEVQPTVAVLVAEPGALAAGEHRREGAAVAAHLGFAAEEHGARIGHGRGEGQEHAGRLPQGVKVA